jgi:hypothetical protein
MVRLPIPCLVPAIVEVCLPTLVVDDGRSNAIGARPAKPDGCFWKTTVCPGSGLPAEVCAARRLHRVTASEALTPAVRAEQHQQALRDGCSSCSCDQALGPGAYGRADT